LGGRNYYLGGSDRYGTLVFTKIHAQFPIEKNNKHYRNMRKNQEWNGF
jgi:hypothetical protein